MVWKISLIILAMFSMLAAVPLSAWSKKTVKNRPVIIDFSRTAAGDFTLMTDTMEPFKVQYTTDFIEWHDATSFFVHHNVAAFRLVLICDDGKHENKKGSGHDKCKHK